MPERDAPSIEHQLRDWSDDLASTVPPYEPPSGGTGDPGRGPRRLLSAAAVVVAVAVVGAVVWVSVDDDAPQPPDPATAVERLHHAVEATLEAPAWQALIVGPLLFEEVVFRAPDRVEWRNGIEEVGTAAIVIGDDVWAYEDGGWSEAGDVGAWSEHSLHAPSRLLRELAAAECVQPVGGDEPWLMVWQTEDGGCGGRSDRLPNLSDGSMVWRVEIDRGRVVVASARVVDEEFPRYRLPLPGEVGQGDSRLDPPLEPLREWLEGRMVVRFSYEDVPEIVPPDAPRPWLPIEVPDGADPATRFEAAGAFVVEADEADRPVWLRLRPDPYRRRIELGDAPLVQVDWLLVDPQRPWDPRRDLEDPEAVSLPDGAGSVLVGRADQFSVVRFDCGPDERIELRSSEDALEQVMSFAVRLSVALDCRGRSPGGRVSGDVGVSAPTECLGLPDDPAACRE